MSRTVRIVGVGMGPQHLTAEAVAALRASSYVIAAAKRADDPLLEVRRAICEPFGLPVIAIPDPERDRTPRDYDGVVHDWHAARADAWGAEIAARAGDPAFLVWGDPSLYDSTIRVVERLGLPYEVVAGISAPQLLAARHRIVLHEVGRPVLITTERRLPEALAAGARNVVVMLTSEPVSVEAVVSRLAALAPQPPEESVVSRLAALAPQPPQGSVVEVRGALATSLETAAVWWGANLGTPSERLVAGRLGEVGEEIAAAREAARAEAGWVMDLYRLLVP